MNSFEMLLQLTGLDYKNRIITDTISYNFITMNFYLHMFAFKFQKIYITVKYNFEIIHTL